MEGQEWRLTTLWACYHRHQSLKNWTWHWKQIGEHKSHVPYCELVWRQMQYSSVRPLRIMRSVSLSLSVGKLYLWHYSDDYNEIWHFLFALGFSERVARCKSTDVSEEHFNLNLDAGFCLRTAFTFVCCFAYSSATMREGMCYSENRVISVF
jgi:hypothetical protein